MCDEARDRGNVAAVSYVGLVEAIDEQVDVIEVASGPRSLEASTMALRERVVVVDHRGHHAREHDAAGRTDVVLQSWIFGQLVVERTRTTSCRQ